MQAQSNAQEQDTVFELIKSQADFISSPARHPAYISAWATGKTAAGIGKAMLLSEKYPRNLGVIFRKEFVDLRDSTVKDFEDYTGLEVDSSRDVRLPNGSIIMFRHLEEMNNIQNINLGWFWIEQVEELATDDPFFKLWGRLRRHGVDHCGFVTGNTKGHNWVYRLWKLRKLKDAALYEAKTKDNAHNLSPKFIQAMEDLRTEKPRIWKRFVDNSWDEEDVSDSLIHPDWVDAAMGRTNAKGGQVILGVDVARGGADETVIIPFFGRRTGEAIAIKGNDTMEVTGKVAKVCADLGVAMVYIDIIGIGAGVHDRLRELKIPVTGVNVSAASKVLDRKTKKPKFKNLRSEVWWRARESLDHRVGMNSAPFSLPNDEMLREELICPKYTINSSGQVEVDSKDEMKETLGRSPDRADAYCLGVYGILASGLRPSAALSGNSQMAVYQPDWA